MKLEDDDIDSSGGGIGGGTDASDGTWDGPNVFPDQGGDATDSEGDDGDNSDASDGDNSDASDGESSDSNATDAEWSD